MSIIAIATTIAYNSPLPLFLATAQPVNTCESVRVATVVIRLAEAKVL